MLNLLKNIEMKYIKYKLIAVALMLGLTFTSCNEWLEMEPINETYGGVFWESESAANQTLAGAYALLRTAVIAQCNLILHETEKLDEDLFTEGLKGKQSYLGQTYFLRAFTYFYMVKIWGDVPLVLDPVLTVTDVITEDGYVKNVGQNPEAEVLDQCIIDLKIAEEYLDYGTFGDLEWAVQGNKGSVQALMAQSGVFVSKLYGFISSRKYVYWTFYRRYI